MSCLAESLSTQCRFSRTGMPVFLQFSFFPDNFSQFCWNRPRKKRKTKNQIYIFIQRCPSTADKKIKPAKRWRTILLPPQSAGPRVSIDANNIRWTTKTLHSARSNAKVKLMISCLRNDHVKAAEFGYFTEGFLMDINYNFTSKLCMIFCASPRGLALL